MSRKRKHERIAIWPGVFLGNEAEQIKNFEDWVLKEWGVRIKYLEDVLTFDRDVFGDPIEGKAGRNDLLFSVHENDIAKFEEPRRIARILWFKDMLNLRRLRRQYPQEILDKYS